MIASYTVVSHRCDIERSPSNDRPSSGGERRIDKLTLMLDAWKMPVCNARRAAIHGRLSDVMPEIERRQDSVRSIVIDDMESPIGESAHVKAHYLTATCPYCGIEEQLEHGRWRVYLADGSRIAHIDDDEPREARRCYVGHPCDWMPFVDGQLAPLRGSYEDLEMPYGSHPPIQEFKAHASQLTLPLEGINGEADGRVYGRTDGYKGIYSCQHCGEAYYVAYNTPHREDPAILAYEAQTPLSTCAQISTSVESSASDITICFSPPLEGRVSTIRFDLVRGYTEVDGLQLMKGYAPMIPSFAHLPLGFSCSELLSLVSSLMPERIGDMKRALQLVKSARCDTDPGSLYGSGINFLDLAVVNRLRGYPDALYESIFHKRAWHPKDCIPHIAPFGALPVDYSEIDKAYELSGLPQCKSVRKAAFEQPLFVAYSLTVRTIPFKDPNILTSLLSSDAALPLFDALSRSCGDLTVFEYLIETRGELATWRHIESLVSRGERLDFLGFGGRGRLFGRSARSVIDRLPVDKACLVLREILAGDACRELDLTGEYEYERRQLELQGSLSDFDFILPPTPLSVILAGAELGNCLSAYAGRIAKRSTIVVVRSEGSAIAAVEVDAERSCVVQAKGKYNKQIPRQGALYSAFTAWLQEKRLEYKPIR